MTPRMEKAILSRERKTRPRHVSGEEKEIFILKFTIGSRAGMGSREEAKVGHSKEQNLGFRSSEISFKSTTLKRR